METITGTAAIDKMRQYRAVPNLTFGLIFFTHSHSEGKYSTASEKRKYENCRLRTARSSEGLAVNSDHYLYFTDTDTDEPRQCWKKLIRQVRFGDTWYKIQWFL